MNFIYSLIFEMSKFLHFHNEKVQIIFLRPYLYIESQIYIKGEYPSLLNIKLAIISKWKGKGLIIDYINLYIFCSSIAWTLDFSGRIILAGQNGDDFI